MSLPLLSNNTGDIYRNGRSPPAAPDVAGVSLYFKADYVMGSEHNEGDAANKWTHIALMDVTVDIRDGYTGNGQFSNAAWDFIWIPDKTKTQYRVVFVERVLWGTASDHKRVYLRQANVTWPSNDV
jgi:hypothetical protein